MNYAKRGRVVRLVVLVPAVLFWLHPGVARAQSVTEGQAIVNTMCRACHTIGGGKLIGPDLAGVTTRRQEAWLFRQIKEPLVLIAEKDPIVMGLLRESNNVPMVPLGLSDVQIRSVIAYLKSTEGRAVVESGLPVQYGPTVLVSILLLVAFTTVGFTVGRRKQAP